ncbi:zf-TFIIB domain-containing protein [Natrinema gelatinilyticum]|uniref:zf-TFIIB domain-containing protein n=1 Tax=Natrinema gelatinilyticum TaxID=2961571 RepID=UPI0020C3F9BA|nr:zf-TFIIB domain-containing protein [Natrinema gelatinilyticum]
MDECPRCGAAMEELSLGEVSTLTCPHCGFADVPVEHQPRRETSESWRDAFNRFYEP